MPWQINGLLQTHTCSAQFHLRGINYSIRNFERVVLLEIFHQSVCSVDCASAIIAYDADFLSFAQQREALCRFAHGIVSHAHANLVAFRH